jgi:4-diphosphocytidyl-2-C-methyl-D-erythritol kinase
MNKPYYAKCYAKLNLFLHVLGKTANGYHELDSLAVIVEDLYDELIIEESKDNQIIIEGQWKNNLSGSNILEKVLAKFAPVIGERKFKIKLTKNIPIAAGLGGGSSNAAELIKFIITKFNLKLSETEITDYCVAIGADVPMFFYNKALYFNGIGEIISPIKTIPPLYALLVYPKILISTSEVFHKGFKEYKKKTDHQYSFKTTEELLRYLKHTSNDLFANSLALEPQLQNVVQAIKENNGCKLARMSGSGSTCFGLFTNIKQAKAALNALQKKNPHYSIYVSKLK